MELGIEISNEFLKNLTKNLYLDLKNIFNKNINTYKYSDIAGYTPIDIIELEILETDVLIRFKIEYSIGAIDNNIINNKIKINIENKNDEIFIIFNLNYINQPEIRKRLLYELIELL